MSTLSLRFPIRPRRFVALLLSLLLALSLLLSAAFILAERHHDCEGEHCKICAAIGQTVAFLRAENGAVTKPLFTALATCVAIGRLPSNCFFLAVVYSPVSLKVKLSD